MIGNPHEGQGVIAEKVDGIDTFEALGSKGVWERITEYGVYVGADLKGVEFDFTGYEAGTEDLDIWNTLSANNRLCDFVMKDSSAWERIVQMRSACRFAGLPDPSANEILDMLKRVDETIARAPEVNIEVVEEFDALSVGLWGSDLTYPGWGPGVVNGISGGLSARLNEIIRPDWANDERECGADDLSDAVDVDGMFGLPCVGKIAPASSYRSLGMTN